MERGWPAAMIVSLALLLTACPSTSLLPEARIEYFVASPMSVAPGEPVALAWRAVNSEACYLQAREVGGEPDAAVAVPCDGGSSHSPTVATRYQLSALKRDHVTYVAQVVTVEVDGGTREVRNVALASLGATTGDNGHFDDGVHGPGPSAGAIDDDPATYWAGLASEWPQTMWVTFDQPYRIHGIALDELDIAFSNTGLLEYFDGTSWWELAPIAKESAGLEIDFPAVDAFAVRLSVHSNTAPAGWYNPVACVTALEVYATVEVD